jgi:hypothetical protein
MTMTEPAIDGAETATPAAPEQQVKTHGTGYRRLAGYALLLLVMVAAIVGARLATRPSVPLRSPVSVGHPAAPVPASPAVEAAWGLRFTNVIVLADNGGVELRYQVIDESKAAKIHLGDPRSNQLPTIQVEGTGYKVTPSSVLMHFHHGDATAGQSYSIVYGNAGGVVMSGDYVAIIMKDGLKIKHVQVSD